MLLALVDAERFLGIVRSDHGRHGGQFALPGGGCQPADTTPWETALREAREEVGLAAPVERLGTLGQYRTVVSDYLVTAEVGRLVEDSSHATAGWHPQPGEVEAVLVVPFAALAGGQSEAPAPGHAHDHPLTLGFDFDPIPHVVAGTLPPRGRGHVLETPAGPLAMPFVWGLTARILADFLSQVWLPLRTGTGPRGSGSHGRCSSG